MGKRYNKDIIPIGRFNVQGIEQDITEDRLNAWIRNTIRAGNKISIPYTHSLDPRDNTGWVDPNGLYIRDGYLRGILDIEKTETQDELDKKLIRDVSIGVDLNYRNEKGEDLGEVIKHIALTLDPAIREQGDFLPAESGGDYIWFSNDELIGGGEVMELTAENKSWFREQMDGVVNGIKALVTVSPDEEKYKALNLEHEELKGKNEKLELEFKAYKDEREKAEVEANAKAWDGLWAEALEGKLVKPTQHDFILEHFAGPKELKLFLETLTPDLNLEGTTVVENQNETPVLTEPEKTVMVKLGLDPEDEKDREYYLKGKESIKTTEVK